MRRWGPLILALVLIGAGLVYWLRGRPSAVVPIAASGSGSSPGAPGAPEHAPVDPVEARKARDAMRAKILETLQKRGEPVRPEPPATKEARTAAATKKDGTEGHGHYDTEYIRTNFREDMFPLLHSCYQDALRRKPQLAGKLILDFTIVGDKDVGGVIDDADINDDSDLKDDQMETCVRESLMTLTFDKPPSGGGYVTVKYPILFSPGDDDGGTDNSPDAG
jgi:hypothetical protein